MDKKVQNFAKVRIPPLSSKMDKCNILHFRFVEQIVLFPAETNTLLYADFNLNDRVTFPKILNCHTKNTCSSGILSQISHKKARD